jgi:hypothetical protein
MGPLRDDGASRTPALTPALVSLPPQCAVRQLAARSTGERTRPGVAGRTAAAPQRSPPRPPGYSNRHIRCERSHRCLPAGGQGTRTRRTTHAAARRQRGRLRDHRRVLHRRAGHRLRRPALREDEPRLLPLGTIAARVDHRPRVRLRESRRPRAARPGGERRPVRHRRRALLLDRRNPGDGLPRARDDALLLRLEGPQRAGVPAPALQQAVAPLQRGGVLDRDDPHRRREPLRARPRPEPHARLADHRRAPEKR